MAKLLYKLEISGIIEVKTGLHIGGSDVDLTIGGIDNEVAKHKGVPYIPGSSLAGKLRHLIAKHKGYKHINFNAAREVGEITGRSWDCEYTALLFNGKHFNIKLKNKHKKYKLRNNTIADDYFDNSDNLFNNQSLAPHTRLLIRDCYLIENTEIKSLLEDKAENFIVRTTGVATPRHIERVVAGAKFQLKMIMDIFENDDVKMLCETLHLGILLLNNDYLGGSGSRGYGEVETTIDKVIKISFGNGSISTDEFTEYNFSLS